MILSASSKKFRKTFSLNMTHPWVYPTYWWPQYNPSLPSDEMVNVTDNIQHLDLNLQARESPPAVTSATRKVAQPVKRRRGTMLQPAECCVCKQAAGPHNYYGARSCIPCRAFFRRSVEEDLKASYFCYKAKNCDMTSQGRKSCKYCRFQACLRGGMRENYVLNEVQKDLLKKKPHPHRIPMKRLNTEEIKKERKPKEPRIKMLPDEDAALIKDWTKQSKIFEQSKSRSYEKHVIQQIIRLILFTNPLSSESKGRIKYEMEYRANKFIERMPYFQSLSSIDRDTIRRWNMPVVSSMQACSVFSPDLSWFEQLSALFGVRDVMKLQRKLYEYAENTMDHRKLLFCDFFDSPDPDDAERFNHLQRQISLWPQDVHEYILLLLLLAFIPHEVNLEIS